MPVQPYQGSRRPHIDKPCLATLHKLQLLSARRTSWVSCTCRAVWPAGKCWTQGTEVVGGDARGHQQCTTRGLKTVTCPSSTQVHGSGCEDKASALLTLTGNWGRSAGSPQLYSRRHLTGTAFGDPQPSPEITATDPPVSPRIFMWKHPPQCDGVRRWGLGGSQRGSGNQTQASPMVCIHQCWGSPVLGRLGNKAVRRPEPAHRSRQWRDCRCHQPLLRRTARRASPSLLRVPSLPSADNTQRQVSWQRRNV